MNQSSNEIHPEKKASKSEMVFNDIGRLEMINVDKDMVLIECEGGNVEVRFYAEAVLNFRYFKKGMEKKHVTQAVIRKHRANDWLVEEDDEIWKLISVNNGMNISGTKNPFRMNIFSSEGELLLGESEQGLSYTHNGRVMSVKSANDNERYYGLGEKTGFLDKKGASYTMWNTDVYAPHNPETDALYQSIPFFISHRGKMAYGLFLDNSGKTHIDLRTDQGTYQFMTENGVLEYFFFEGPTLKDVVKQYTWLTGRMELPPKWAIGYHQSRYSYETEKEAMDVVDAFQEKNIPLDAICLDIHYMNGYRVFTFDEDSFNKPFEFIMNLKKKGVHVIPIVDPGVKVDAKYELYQAGVKEGLFSQYLNGRIYYGEVWPGQSAFPDFMNDRVRRWWGDLHKFYINLGIEGIWNDMNEPAVFNDTLTMDVQVMHKTDTDRFIAHEDVHNIYGFLMCKATFEGMKDQLNGRRTFVLTRSGYAGIQRYAAVWTGDNRSFWEHLQLSLPMCLNLGLSGVAFSGADVGGFAHDTSGQLLARWTQVGAFIPYFRNHSSIDTIRQEPWMFGEEIEAIVKKYIQLRYQWMPELYKWFKEASNLGLPVMRPLVLEFPLDKETYNCADQFMVGEATMIAPIMMPDTTHRSVYFPHGEWVDYWTGKRYEGGQYHLVYADLTTLPIYIRAGYAIAQGSVKQHSKVIEQDMQVHFYLPKKEETSLSYDSYDDDGESHHYQNNDFSNYSINITVDHINLKIEVITVKKGSYKAAWESSWKIVLHGDFLEGERYLTTINANKVSPYIQTDKEIMLDIS